MNKTVIISKKLVFINSCSGILTHLLNIFVLVWLQRYLLEHISTDEYSLYPVLMSLVVFLPLITSMFSGGISRYLVEAYARDEQDRITRITSTMFVVLLLCSPVLLGLGGFVAINIQHILTIAPEWEREAQIMMGLLIVNFVVSMVLIPFQLGLYATQRFVAKNMVDLFCQVLRLGLLCLFLFGISPGVLWVVVSSVIASFTGVMIQVFLSRRYVPALRFRRSHIRWSLVGDLVSFGGWSLLAVLAERIRMFSDPIILNKLSSSFDVTCYYLGSLPQRQLQRFAAVAQVPLTPVLTTMVAVERKDQMRSAFLRGCRVALWCILAITIPLMVFSGELIRLWVGQSFLPTATVMVLLHLGYPLVTSMQLLPNVAVATGDIRPYAIRMLLAQMMNLSLTLFLVGRFNLGALGAASASLATMVVFQPILMIPLGWRLVNVSAKQWCRETLWPGCLPALVAAGFWWMAKMVFQPTGVWALFGVMAVGICLYGWALWLFAAKPRDKQDARRAVSLLYQKLRSAMMKRR